jgi:hypothetical protein
MVRCTVREGERPVHRTVTVGDQEIRDRILIERAGHAVVMLNGILSEDATVDVPWSTSYRRARLAGHPAEGYKTWAERLADSSAALDPGRADRRT